MYDIGIISTDLKGQECIYKEELSAIDCFPTYLSIDSVKKEVLNKDAYIIEDTSMGQSPRVFELILMLRADYNGILWLITKESTATFERFESLCFRLGVNGISKYHSEKEGLFLQLKNILNYSGKQRIEKNLDKLKKIVLVPRNLSVLKDGKEIRLTRLEYQLLEILFSSEGQSKAYEEINREIWGDRKTNYYKIANLIFNLRKKVETDPSRPEFIKTVCSVGYRLALQEE